MMRQETIIERQAEKLMEHGNTISDLEFDINEVTCDFINFYRKVEKSYMDYSSGEIGGHTMSKQLRKALFNYEYKALEGES